MPAFVRSCSTIGTTPSIETSEHETAANSMTRRSSSGGLLSPEVELSGTLKEKERAISLMSDRESARNLFVDCVGVEVDGSFCRVYHLNYWSVCSVVGRIY